MKLLLTSSGISDPSIDEALVGLLGKPIAESSALIIPTATVEVVSEGNWKLFTPDPEASYSV
jgi:dipeptidase E